MGHKVKQSLMSSRIDFFYYAFRNVLLVSIPLLVVCGVVLSHLSFNSSATGSSTDQIQFSLSSSCTMSSVVGEAHTKEINNGTYHSDVGKTTITTLCNDGNGYSVYAVGYSNNEEGNNKLINSSYPQYSIDTGLATNGLTSTWAMKLNNIPDDPSPTPPTIESDYNNVYGIVPPYWTKVASRASGTTDMAQGSSFTTTYAVYASSSQYAGTYVGQVQYVLIHPSQNADNINLENSFISHGKNRRHIEGTGDYFAMQDMTTNICNSVSGSGEATSIQLVDIRDNKLYWVTKLKDGHCWMTQNLDLDLIQNKTYTHADTDLGWAPDNFNVNATWKPTGDLNWAQQKFDPYYVDLGNKYVYTSNSDADDIIYDSLSSCTSAGHTDCEHYHIGNYYNWNAARANGDDNTSICPAGWRLPNLDSNEYGNLLANYNIIQNNTSTTYLENGFNNIRKAPLYFIRAGSKGDIASVDTAPGSGAGTYFYNKTTLYVGYLSFKVSTINPIANNQYDAIRWYSFPMRCVAR